MAAITLVKSTNDITLVTGAAGPRGAGFSTGGTTGQILAKASATDYDTEWISFGSINQRYTVDDTGATDVSSTLQTAITAIAALGDTIYLDEGIYNCGSATLTIPDDARVVFLPNTELRRTAAPGSAAPLVALGDDVSLVGGKYTTTETTAVSSSENCAISAKSKTGVDVRDALIEGKFNIGIKFEACTNSTATRCNVYGVKNRGLYAYLTCDNIDWDNCFVSGYELGTSTNYTNYCINTNPGGSTNTINNIRIHGCDAVGADTYGISIGDETYDYQVESCTAVDCSSYGFLVHESNSGTPGRGRLTGCHAEANSHGYYILDATDLILSHCYAYNNTSRGCFVSGSVLVSVNNCHFKDNTSDGLFINNSAGNTADENLISSNIAEGNGGYGINIDTGVTGTRLNGNLLTNNTSGTLNDSGTNTVIENGAAMPVADFTTDNAIVTADGTGRDVQDTGVTIDDSDNLTTTGIVRADGGIASGGALPDNYFADFQETADELMTFRIQNTTTASGKGARLIMKASSGQYSLIQYNASSYHLSTVPLLFQCNGTGNYIQFFAGSTEVVRMRETYLDIKLPAQFPTYTVATLPTATAAQMIYVSDETGGAVMAFADGTNWRRVTDRAVVS